MKMFFMVYDADFDEDVISALTAADVAAYTKWDRILGKGRNSEPRLDDPVWPGFNQAVALVVEDDIGDRLFAAMKELSSEIGENGFKVFELPVLRVI